MWALPTVCGPAEWLRHDVGGCTGKETPLSEGQRAALLRASRAPLIVLTGGPGCGKTFATKAIVQLWVSQGKDVKLAAPTGQRLARLICILSHFNGFLVAFWLPWSLCSTSCPKN